MLIAVLLAIAEVTTLSFVLLGMALGMVSVALIQFAAGGGALGRDVLCFAVASLVAIVVFRRVFRKRTDQERLEGDDINRY